MADAPTRPRRTRTPAQEAREAALSDSQKTIRGKRRSSSRRALTEKSDRGELHGNERALVRVGKQNTRILIGAEDLTEWDLEELRAGRRRSANGSFDGKAPVIVPKAIHDELVKRTLSEAQRLLTESLDDAVQALTSIVKDNNVDAKDRLKASQMILDRVMGKNPETVKVTGEAKWEQALTAGIVATTPRDLGHSDGDWDDEGDDVE